MNLAEACNVPLDSDVKIVDRMDDWKQVLSRDPFKSLISTLKRKYPKEISLTLDYRDIQSAGKLGTELADEILEKPLKVVQDIQDTLWHNRMIIIEGNFHVNVRFTHLPRKTPVRDIRADDIGKLISVEGIIRKASEVRPRLTLAVFRCKAGHRNVKAQGFGPMVEPDGCQADGCNNKKFELLPPPHSKFIDSQRLKLQELPEGLRGGEQPESIDIDVLDDICATATPGTRVVLNGIVKQFQRRSQGQLSTTFDIYIECNSIEFAETDFDDIEIREEDEEDIKTLAALPWQLNPDTNIPEPGVFSKIAQSIAPSIFGITNVKRAIALQMFSGIPKELPDGTRIRGDVHILMIGDPGIAKSQLIRYVTKLVPRSMYASGKSASAAGLTASAVKDEFDGRWTLEAGAFVMADKGIMGLDEIEKCDKAAQSSIHEAMEQQSISVAKAGITASLQCRCSVLAAGNPAQGRFDDYTGLAEQFNMPPSLLSRFDIIFLMSDKPETTRDEMLAWHILNTHQYGEELVLARKEKRVANDTYEGIIPGIPPVLLRKYIAYAKANVYPKMTREAMQKLNNYFTSIRSLADTSDKPVPVTARAIEALIRLAEAAARMELSPVVTEDHASVVIQIVDESLKQVAYDPKTGTFDIDRVVSDKPKSQRDMIRAIEKRFDDLKNDNGLVSEHDLITSLADDGHSRLDIINQVDKMKRECVYTEKKGGYLKRL
jgi:replicative DNA helicase Mcm